MIDNELENIWSVGAQMAKMQCTVSLAQTTFAYKNHARDVWCLETGVSSPADGFAHSS